MARIDVCNCDSWNEYKTLFLADLYSDQQFQRGNYIFRGHMASEWPLTSSFDRWMEDSKLSERPTLADRLIQLFIQELKRIDEDLYKNLGEDLQKYALAQHYGVPTRMLDWSYSPYIAAFFAFGDAGSISESEHIREVAIWALNAKLTIWGDAHGASIVEPPVFLITVDYATKRAVLLFFVLLLNALRTM